ncbi:hypothetical protein G7K_6519-t1 [Saitoella complicata NRRL Y-17804]|uniref:Uncharacterized protein n=1 Tax=Saitoella complicata (strain BCRC 22490 / CBS 7301 / JCM 7358 / NBRC 10748 / NRRL Y-17804) TaxID=698492 RepID=A0A0E9NRN8_SAICN|nr:hypothetical protein G7K_6519-t1 [Saitoella complicata NRRL Y-17804]
MVTLRVSYISAGEFLESLRSKDNQDVAHLLRALAITVAEFAFVLVFAVMAEAVKDTGYSAALTVQSKALISLIGLFLLLIGRVPIIFWEFKCSGQLKNILEGAMEVFVFVAYLVFMPALCICTAVFVAFLCGGKMKNIA